MKRICIILIMSVLCVSMIGCSGSVPQETQSDPPQSETSAKQQTDSVTPDLSEESDSSMNDTADNNESEDVVDLTVLSSTMVYSEVYNMTVTPEDYNGRTVKTKGQFAVYQDIEKNKNYYFVIVSDATACCQQGLEFVLDGDYKYPDDYPAKGTEITVTGTFETYEEDGYNYCNLTNAKMEIE